MQADRRRQLQRAVPIAWLIVAGLYWVDYGVTGRTFSLLAAVAWSVLGAAMGAVYWCAGLQRKAVRPDMSILRDPDDSQG